MVHANEELGDCWGYAVPRRFLVAGGRAWEYAVVGPPLSEAVYAHEVLHLFGADDFYMSAYNRDEHEVRRDLLRRCIMFGDARETIDTLFVDDLTAQNIGWM
jgi:hypothetical protein